MLSASHKENKNKWYLLGEGAAVDRVRGSYSVVWCLVENLKSQQEPCENQKKGVPEQLGEAVLRMQWST